MKALLVCFLLVVFMDCSRSTDLLPGQAPAPLPAVERLVPQVLSARPHDKTAFTEGLLLHDGSLYESTGLYGQSTLRQVDPQTGKVLRQTSLPRTYFGEGLALQGNRLVQLTWHEQVAFIYDLKTFATIGSFSYSGEGWGLCFDGAQFFQTDGSATIWVRDAATFQVVRQLSISLDSQPVTNLNELECVNDSLYVNVWHTNDILRIDKRSGQVTAQIDAAGLLTPEETAAAGTEGVLNGIAYDADHGTFLITGKLWPWLFEVRFIPRTPTLVVGAPRSADLS
jgi:glutamine cyclotransferase